MRALVLIFIFLQITYILTWDISLKITQEIDETSAGEPFPIQPIITVYRKNGKSVQTDFVGYVVARLHHSVRSSRLGRIQENNSCLGNSRTTPDADDDYDIRAEVVRGVAKFHGLCINKAHGDYRIQYTVKDEFDITLTDELGRLFSVLIGPASRLGIVTQPVDAVAGIPWLRQPVLSVHDKGGNTVISEWKGTVRVELVSDRLLTETLLCSEVCSGFNVSFNYGVATFKGLYIRRASEYRLKFYTDLLLSEGQSVLSDLFNVKTGAARKLELIQEPGNDNVYGGKAFVRQPRLNVVDAGGNLLTSDSSSVVAVYLHSNPYDGELFPDKNLVAPVESGIVQFKHLVIDKAGEGYTLMYRYLIYDQGYLKETEISVIGNKFTVQVGSAHRLKLINKPSKMWAGNQPFLLQPKLALVDAGGNVLVDESSTFVSALLTPSLAHSSHIVIDTSSGPIPQIVKVTFDESIQLNSRTIFSTGDLIGLFVVFNQEVTVSLKSSHTKILFQKPFFTFDPPYIENRSVPARAVLSDKFVNCASRVLLFVYEVHSGQDRFSLAYPTNTSIQVSDFLISDAWGRDVSLVLPNNGDSRNQLNSKLIRIDSTPAFVRGISLYPSCGEYGAGQELFLQVQFSRKVTVFGNPKVPLNVRSSIAVIDTLALGSSFSRSYFFIRFMNTISKAIPWNVSAFNLGRKIRDVLAEDVQICVSRSYSLVSNGGYRWVIRFDSLVSLNSLQIVTAQVPDQDQTMVLNVSYFEVDHPSTTWVADCGDEFMCTKRYASYHSGSGTEKLTFIYVVQPGDSVYDLNVLPSESIAFSSYDDRICNFVNQDNSCSVSIDASLKNVTIVNTLPTTIDTSAPYVVSVELNSDSKPNTTYHGGDSLMFDVHFSSAVVVKSDLILLLNVGRESYYASYLSGSGTSIITLEYTVRQGHYAANLDFHRTKALFLPPDAHVRRLSSIPTTDATLVLPPYVASLTRYGICINGLPPKVKDVSIPEEFQGSVFRQHDKIFIVIQFTDQVTILADSLIFVLDVGGREREAVYVSGNNSDSITFAYTVILGDQASPLTFKCRTLKTYYETIIIPVYQYSLNPTVPAEVMVSDLCDFQSGGPFIDTTRATLTKALTAELFEPTVGVYSIGEEVKARVLFSDEVFCRDYHPLIYLGTGSSMLYESGCGSNQLIFHHIVEENDITNDLQLLRHPSYDSPIICDSPCRLVDGNGVEIDTTSLRVLTPNVSGISIDAEVPVPLMVYTRPYDIATSCPFTAGDEILIYVKFSLPVVAQGKDIYFKVGGLEELHAAHHADKSNSTDIAFLYTVPHGNINASSEFDIECPSRNGFIIIIHSEVGDVSYIRRQAKYPHIDVDLKLPETCDIHHKSSSCRVIEAIVSPHVLKVYCDSPDGVYSPGDEIRIVIVWSHPVHVEGFPTLLLDSGRISPGVAVYSSGSDSKELLFIYSVQPEHYTMDLDVIDPESFDFTHGRIFRASKSPTILVDKALPVSGDPRSLSANADIAVDSRVPHITSVWSPLKSGIYSVDDTIIIIIEFSRPVIVLGFPSIMLAIGKSSSREAIFVFQPTIISLYFEYKIHLGDESLRLDYWTDQKLKVSPSLRLNGGSIMLRSSRPIVDADLHLNPGAGYLLGKVEEKLQNGIVDFLDLSIGSRGLAYKVRFSAIVNNYTLEATADVEVDPSCEFELIANMMDRNENDHFGYSTSVSNEIVAVGAPYAMNPLPDVQVISFTVDTLNGANVVQVIETKILSNDATLQVQTFNSSAFAGETINGSISIAYYNMQNYPLGAPIIVPADVESSFLGVVLEKNYPFLRPISVSRTENRLCMCQNGWSWTISYHDDSYGTGVFRASDVSLTGLGSMVSGTSIIQSARLISGSFLIHSRRKNMRSRSIPFDVTGRELASILEHDMGLDIINVHAINTNYQDKPDLGRRWTVTYSTCGDADDTCSIDFDIDGTQLLGTDVSAVSFTTSKGRLPIGGSFALSMLDSNFSSYIPYNATSNEVQKAIESLESVERVSVTSKQSTIGDQKIFFTWTITYLSVNRNTRYGWVPEPNFYGNLPLINVKSDKLVGYNLSVLVEYVSAGVTGRESGRVTIFGKRSDIWQPEASLLASDHKAYDHFGHSVSISVDFLIAGSPSNEGGSAYIFERKSQCAFCVGFWTETRKLSPTDGMDEATESSEFGFSVLITISKCNDMFALIGSPGFDNDSGKVYIFGRVNEDWVFHSSVTSQKFTVPKISDRFGQVIAFDDNTLAAGAPGFNRKHGAVFIFQQGEDCGYFLPSQAIYGPNGTQPGDMFGFALSLHGNGLVICSPYRQVKEERGILLANAGMCFVYRRMDRSADFILVQSLLTSNLKSKDRFGYSVALSSNKLVVGQVEEFNGLLTSQCPVQVIRTYSHSTSGKGRLGGFFRLSWKQGSSKTRPISSTSSASFLRHVLEEDLVTGAVYVKRSDADIDGGYMWSVTFKASSISESTFPSLSCSVDDMTGPSPACSVTVVHDVLKKTRGKVHLFTLESEKWVEQAYLFPRLPQKQDLFGASVSLDGDVAVVGSPNRELMNINSGSAIVYDLTFADIHFARPRYIINEGERIEIELRRNIAYNPLIVGLRTIDRNAVEQVQSYINQLYSFRSGEIFPKEYTPVDFLERNTAFGRSQYYGSEDNRSQWVDGMFDYRGISDYNSIAVQVYMETGKKTATVFVETTNDKIFEAPDEKFSVHISLPGMFASPLGKLHSNITIKDDGDGLSTTEVHYRKIFGSQTKIGDHMGSVIATDSVSGIMLVGGSRSTSSEAGIVYIYGKNGSFWQEEAVLTPSNSTNSSSFGRSICIRQVRDAKDRLTVMIGAPGQSRAYIYVRSTNSLEWREESILQSPHEHYVSPEDMFADHGAIALDGDAAFVGVAGLNMVLVYRRISYNISTDLYSWELWKVLQSTSLRSDFILATNIVEEKQFGACVAASRRLLLVGAPAGNAGRVHIFYSPPQVQRIKLSFASKPLYGTLKLRQSEQLHSMMLETSMLVPLSDESKSEELQSYIENYLKLGDVSVLVSIQNSSRYEIIWDITFWDIFNDGKPLLIPVWKGNGCDECDEFSSFHDSLVLISISTGNLQNVTFYQPEDVLIPEDSSSGDGFGHSVALDGNHALVGAIYSSAKTRTTWNFETGDLTGWSLSGTAFKSQPIFTKDKRYPTDESLHELYHKRSASARGNFYIDTFFIYDQVDDALSIQGNSPIGTLTSDPFTIVGDTISFMIGGGCDHLTTYVELLVDGIPTLRATGRCDDEMIKSSWEVLEFKYRSGQIKVVDEGSTAWGHIKVDEFTFEWKTKSPTCLPNNVGQCADGGGEIYHSNSTFERAYLGPEETAMSGAAYLFGRTCGVNNLCSWTEIVRFVASDKRSGDNFGFSVALDDVEGVAVVGSPNAASMGIFKEIPSVYPHLNTSYIDFPLLPQMESYMKSGYTHSPLQGHLRSTNHYAYTNGAEIERSTPSLFNQQHGAVYLFHRKNADTGATGNFPRWETTEAAKIAPPDAFASDMFGYSLGIDTSYLAVGAVGNDDCCGESGGALYFFDMKWHRAHFDQYQYIVLEGADNVAVVKIVRDKAYIHQRLTVGYSTSDLSAVGVDKVKFRRCCLLPLNQREGCGDYEQSSGEVSFDIGEDSVSFQVRIVDDLCWERHAEYIHLQLHIPGGVAIHGPGFRAHIKIDDDDWPGRLSTKMNCTNKIS